MEKQITSDLPYWFIKDNQTLFTEDINGIYESEKSKKKDLIYLRMAREWSQNSHALRKKVGCLVVKDKMIISDGFNGTPHGFDNSCENTINDDLVTKKEVLHAEANAITKLAKSSQSSDGATIYVTLSPCYECSKLMVQSGIKKVVFQEVYRDTASLEFLRKAGIEIIRISNLDNNK
jgi:dCMP deaminase